VGNRSRRRRGFLAEEEALGVGKNIFPQSSEESEWVASELFSSRLGHPFQLEKVFRVFQWSAIAGVRGFYAEQLTLDVGQNSLPAEGSLEWVGLRSPR
jgi:hypothetical protein